MLVSNLFDPALLPEYLDRRLLTARRHPTLPLTIYNYSDSAQAGWLFDNVTRQCRGLVLDDNNRVIARPMDKFMNRDQPGADVIDLDEPITVFDKADGSLIIFTYDEEFGPIVSSRGSFESDQAKLANEMLKGAVPRNPRLTYMLELVGPSNRIVLEYPEDELIVLGARAITSGKLVHPVTARHLLDRPDLKTVESFPYHTLRELLSAPDRDGAEGYVIQTPDGRMLKHKFDAYVDLHRIIFGMNIKTIWEMLGEGKTVEVILEELPDEIHGFVIESYEQLSEKFTIIEQTARTDLDSAPRGVDRKTFAQYAFKTEYPHVLLAMMDNRDYMSMIHKMIKPKVGE